MRPPKHPIQLGLVGAGAWAGDLARCLAEMRGVRLSAIWNRSIGKARDLAAQFQIEHVYPDLSQLCQAAELEGIMVATHESAHLPATLAALDAGKHVFVEKPMADTAASARAMAERARQTGRILMPGHILRFERRCQAAKARLAQAGEVRAIRCFQHRPKRHYPIYCRPHVSFSLMVHHLDLCRWFAGSPVVAVDCREQFSLGPDDPSTAWAILDFANGAVATLQSGWVFDTDSPAFGEDGIEIITEKERITLEFACEGFEARSAEGVTRPEFAYNVALRAELEYWVACLEDGRQPEVVTADDGVEAVELAERVLTAGKKRRAPR